MLNSSKNIKKWDEKIFGNKSTVTSKQGYYLACKMLEKLKNNEFNTPSEMKVEFITLANNFHNSKKYIPKMSKQVNPKLSDSTYYDLLKKLDIPVFQQAKDMNPFELQQCLDDLDPNHEPKTEFNGAEIQGYQAPQGSTQDTTTEPIPSSYGDQQLEAPEFSIQVVMEGPQTGTLAKKKSRRNESLSSTISIQTKENPNPQFVQLQKRNYELDFFGSQMKNDEENKEMMPEITNTKHPETIPEESEKDFFKLLNTNFHSDDPISFNHASKYIFLADLCKKNDSRPPFMENWKIWNE